MVRNIRRVLLAISTLMVLSGAAYAEISETESIPVRSKQCFEESIPMLEGVLHEFATSYMDCQLYKETEVGGLYHRINQNSKNVVVAPIVDDGGLYKDYIVDPVEKCQNASKRAYVENTARNFKMLDTCLRSTESLVSTTTEVTTVDDEMITTTTTTDDSEISTGSSLLTTTTEKTVEPPKGGGSNSILKMNVTYLLLCLNILKCVLHSI